MTILYCSALAVSCILLIGTTAWVMRLVSIERFSLRELTRSWGRTTRTPGRYRSRSTAFFSLEIGASGCSCCSTIRSPRDDLVVGAAGDPPPGGRCVRRADRAVFPNMLVSAPDGSRAGSLTRPVDKSTSTSVEKELETGIEKQTAKGTEA